MGYICKYCDNEYSSYQSRSNHYKKYHTKDSQNVLQIPPKSSEIPPKSSENPPKSSKNELCCEYCNKTFSRIDNYKRHMKDRCKNKKNNDELKKELEQVKNQMATLLNTKAKIHPKTLQKINNQLNNSNNTTNNTTNNTNNGTIVNNTINNTYVKFGKVELAKVLSEKQILTILNKPFFSLEEAITMVHFNKKLPEYNNIYITNMKDNLAYVFDGKNFVSVRKNDIIAEMITNYAEEIEMSFDEKKDKMSEFRIRRLQSFLDTLNDENKYTDGNNHTHPNYKAYKMSDIKRLIYNNTDTKKLKELNKMELNEKVLLDDEDE
jgi:hypothetical protein